MNESFRIRILLDGAFYPITDLQSDGLIFANETDAWPRRMTLALVPRSDTANYRMRRVREINSWPYPEYHLKLAVAGGALVFSGVNPNGLPSGDYRLSLEVEDLPAVAERYKLYIPDDDHADIEFQVATDPRTIELSSKPRDPAIERILQASLIDSMSASTWLQDTTRRSNRRACLLNLLAKVRSIPEDDSLKPLINEVKRIFFAGTERIYTEVTPGFYEDLKALARDPRHPFYLEGTPKAPIHQQLLIKAGAAASDYDLISFRQEGTTCMQAVVAVPKQSTAPYYADLDIDLGNPLQDVRGFIIHISELLSDGVTDHLALADKLTRNKYTSPYMAYAVTA
jgi:hypothetical protein